MKPIFFSISEPAHSTAFTRGIESHIHIDNVDYVLVPHQPDLTNILIQDGLTTFMCNGLTVNGDKAMLNHYRYNKRAYNTYFNHMAKIAKLEKYHHVISYKDSFAISHEVRPGDIDYLLRPAMGARGLGFIEVPSSRYTMNALETLVSKWTKEEFDDAHFEKTLKKIEGKISASPNVSIGEVKESLKGGFDFVKVVRNIKAEYRILTDYSGGIGLVVRREQLDYGLSVKQASGGYQNTDQIISMTAFVAEIEEIAAPLKKFFDLVKMPIHSFDLFVTHNNEWGFFEGCNQFGCTTVPDGWVRHQTGQLLGSIGRQLQR